MKLKKIYKIRPDILAKYLNEIIKFKYNKILKKNIYLEKNSITILYNNKTYIISVIEFDNELYWHLYHDSKTILFCLSLKSFKYIINLIHKNNI